MRFYWAAQSRLPRIASHSPLGVGLGCSVTCVAVAPDSSATSPGRSVLTVEDSNSKMGFGTTYRPLCY